MGFDDGVGNCGFPFNGANGEDRPPSIRADVAQAVSEIALSLPTQSRDAVWRSAEEDLGIDFQTAQEFQAVKQAVR